MSHGRADGPAARQEHIAELVLARGEATAQDLAAQFGVSLMTIHRDLDELERQGIVRKSRGGVTAQPSGVFESNVAYRRKTMLEAKRAIGLQAVRHVERGMSIMLDDSTTTLAMVPHLAAVTPLHVVTNFLEAMRQLSTVRDISLVGLGGDYDPLHDSFLGVLCVECIESLRVDAAFVSTSAIAGDAVYHQEQRIVSVKRAMLASAGRRYLLMDHSKFGKVALHRLAPVRDFDVVIVDPDTPPATLEELEGHGVAYEVAAR